MINSNYESSSSLSSITMFSTLGNVLFLHFDLWSFCTEYSPTTFRRKFGVIINGIHQCFLPISTVFVIYQHFVDDLWTTQAYLASEAMKPYTAMIMHWLIVMESIVSRVSQRNYWILLENIQKLQNNPKIKLLPFSLWYIHGVCILLFAEVVFTFQFFEPNFEYLVNVTIFAMQCGVYQNRIHHYSLHLEIVSAHLEYVIRYLETTSKSQLLNLESDNSILSAFQSNYLLIAESIERINHIFGWSNAATILFSFNMLLSSINWFVEIVRSSELSFGICRLFRFY